MTIRLLIRIEPTLGIPRQAGDESGRELLLQPSDHLKEGGRK
jgi:hypothetical protein